MERALRLLLDWGFTERGFETVIWWAHRGNWASRKVAWRLGFTIEGSARQWLTQRGELRDAWVGTLLATDALQPRTPWLDAPRIARRARRAPPPRPRRRGPGRRGLPGPHDRPLAGPDPAALHRRPRARLHRGPSRGRRLGAGHDLGDRRPRVGPPGRGGQPLRRRAAGAGRGRLLGAPRRARPRRRHGGHAPGGAARVRAGARTAASGWDASAASPPSATSPRGGVLEKAGLVEQGRERRGTLLGDGTRADVVVLDVLAEELSA